MCSNSSNTILVLAWILLSIPWIVVYVFWSQNIHKAIFLMIDLEIHWSFRPNHIKRGRKFPHVMNTCALTIRKNWWVRLPEMDLIPTFVIFFFPGFLWMWPHNAVFLRQDFYCSVQVSVQAARIYYYVLHILMLWKSGCFCNAYIFIIRL